MRVRQLLARLSRWLVYAVVACLAIVVLGLLTLQTGWAKNRIRGLIEIEANRYLTATLTIGRLEGSLLRGLTLGDVLVSRNGRTLISIDDVSISYSIRELFEEGTSIRTITLAHPHVVAQRQADGRWDLAALLKRDARQQQRSGPGRPIHIRSIEVSDGSISLLSPLTFGAAHVPAEFHDLDLSMSFDYQPVAWRVQFASASFVGAAPDLRVDHLSGEMADGPEGWSFSKFLVETPKSHYTLDGRIERTSPATLDLNVAAERFAFQEWGGILTGLQNIAVDAQFDATLKGPLTALATDISLRSSGGNVRSTLVLDTVARGWRGTGTADIERLNMGRWLNREDRHTDITGHVTFGLTDIGLRPGGRFPAGTYTFDGSHAGFLDYDADDLKATGKITATEVLIDAATATAYGANVRLDAGSIAIDAPYRFVFKGLADGVDLRQVPKAVPVPHVASTLTFEYHVNGQFSQSSFIAGRALFGDSTFLEARVGAGTVGTIDTSATPFRYSGEGDLTGVSLHHFGDGLDVKWLADPRYAGTVSGHFHVEGGGADSATMTLTGGGRVTRADLFGGQLTDGDVTIHVEAGSLTGSYNGALSTINPAIALDDQRFAASLTGSGRGQISVRDLLVRSPVLADYAIDVELSVAGSRVRTVALDTATLTATLRDGTLEVARFHATGPMVDLDTAGRVEFDGERSSALNYTITRGNLALLTDLLGRDLSGDLVTTGRLTGPTPRIRLAGDGTASRIETGGVRALTATLQYDVTVPTDAPARSAGTVNGRLTFIEAFGEDITDASGSASYDDGRIATDVNLQRKDGLTGRIAGKFLLHPDERRVDLQEATLTLAQAAWRLVPNDRSRISWNDRGVQVDAVALVDAATETQRVAADGTWYPEGGGSLHVTAEHVSLDALAGTPGPARYGGLADFDAIIQGTRQRPTVTGTITVTDGRVWRASYEKLAGTVNFADGAFEIDVRLDQRPGVWLTAQGRVPIGLFYADQPESPIDVKIASSAVDLGLLEGITDVARNVSGVITLNVNVIGTSKDPHFDGRVDVTDAAFLAVGSGARYKNGRFALQLARDRVTVDTFHLEDANGHSLEVRGSLGTHELRVGDLAIDVTAREFELLRNTYGRMDVNATLSLRGQFESPKLTGSISIASGQLNVDPILARTMLQPYSTTAAAAPTTVDPIKALNPWDRIGLNLELHVPGTLRMVGDNVQLTPGTPLGLGAINLRAIGDLYLYKDPAQPLYVTGSLDSLTGTYAFQGRRFDLDPVSSITFQGDFNPELYVTVTREINGVEARVTIAGSLDTPELRLASIPPLEPSDILSLVVFNTSANQLSTLQQQQLAVRAGALAAGFLAAPMMSALERSLGLDTFEIEPGGDELGSARVTIGNEIAPGLVARFSRQFGNADYDEASLEYYLSKILRLRATFSDADVQRSPFRRVERAGVDLLLFFSF